MGELVMSMSAILAVVCVMALSKSRDRQRRPDCQAESIHRLESIRRLVLYALTLEAGIWLALTGMHFRWLPGRVNDVIIGWWLLAPSLAAGVIGLAATTATRERDRDDGDMTAHSESS